MNTMLFINSDLNKQGQALEVKISRTTKSYHSILTDAILTDFCHHILVRNAQMYIRLENLVN